MISTLFQNTLSSSFHAIVQPAIQISLCQNEWPLSKLFYANIFPTGTCPLALLLIYPKYSAHTFCFSFFHFPKIQVTRAQRSPFPLCAPSCLPPPILLPLGPASPYRGMGRRRRPVFPRLPNPPRVVPPSTNDFTRTESSRPLALPPSSPGTRGSHSS